MLHATRDAGGDRLAQINAAMHVGEYLGEIDVGGLTRAEYEWGKSGFFRSFRPPPLTTPAMLL